MTRFVAAGSHAAPVELTTLKAGDRAQRFEASTIYLDAAGRPLGARAHARWLEP